MNWKQKVGQVLRCLHGVSLFYSIWVLLKFVFTLREYQKTANLLKKEKEIIGIMSKRLVKSWDVYMGFSFFILSGFY